MNEEKIQNCIDQIESCEFESEGRPLRMNMGWVYLLINIQQLQDALEERETIIRKSITALDVEPESVLPSSLPNEVARLRQKLIRDSSLLIHLYNSGYCAGHHHTVEGTFTPLHTSDMDSYHEEEVMELVANLKALS